jgi:hypothetical protein
LTEVVADAPNPNHAARSHLSAARGRRLEGQPQAVFERFAPEQVFLVRSRIDGWHRRQAGALVRSDLHANLVGDRGRDFALQLEEICRVSFEVTGPQMRV